MSFQCMDFPVPYQFPLSAHHIPRKAKKIPSVLDNKKSRPPTPPLPESTGVEAAESTGNKVAENEASGVNETTGTRVLTNGVS